jgi:hypothetical protein
MKKNSLSTAVVAGIAGIAGLSGMANAVNVNPDGLGQVLLYPYYTVNGGNSTLVSIVNTTDQAKAVKVRKSSTSTFTCRRSTCGPPP